MALTNYSRLSVITAIQTALKAMTTTLGDTLRTVEYGPENTFLEWYESVGERFPAVYIEAGVETYDDDSLVDVLVRHTVKLYCVYLHNANSESLTRETDYIEGIIEAILDDPTLGGVVSNAFPVMTTPEVNGVEHPYRAFEMEWDIWATFERP